MKFPWQNSGISWKYIINTVSNSLQYFNIIFMVIANFANQISFPRCHFPQEFQKWKIHWVGDECQNTQSFKVRDMTKIWKTWKLYINGVWDGDWDRVWDGGGDRVSQSLRWRRTQSFRRSLKWRQGLRRRRRQTRRRRRRRLSLVQNEEILDAHIWTSRSVTPWSGRCVLQ